MSSRPPRSRSSMFIAPTRTPSQSSNASKPTLLSKLRRVSSFSSLSGSSRTLSPPTTPTAPSSPSIRDDYDTLPQDIPPRSSSVMSWFSSDEEADSSKRPWKMPKLRRKNRLSPKSPTFTFTTSAAELASENSRPSSSLAAPLYFSSGPSLLPAVYPLELDLALDFDCAFPSQYDSDNSGPPSPPFPESFSMPRQHFGSPTTMLHRPRESVCWYDDRDQEEDQEEDVDSQTLYAPSSSSDSPHTSLAWSSIRTSSRSPDMTEDDEAEDDDFGKFRPDEIDPDVCRQLAAFRILPDAPKLIATPRTPSLRPSSSTESLLDPHFDSPCTPSPSSTFSSTFSHTVSAEPVSPKFALNFPLPPTCPLSTQKSMSFVSFEMDDDEFFDCTS